MKGTIKSIVKQVFNLLVEKGSYLSLKKNPNILKLAWYTLRFRLGGMGVMLTLNERRIASLKNKHLGERCFIIGNGPSLNNLDLTKLTNEYTFGVNAIYLNREKMGFDPTYYVVEDYLVAEDRSREISDYTGPKAKFFGSYLDYCIEKDSNTITLNVCLNYDDENFKPNFSKNLVRKVWVGGSVTYICLQLAYFMGFQTVYMIGFDHSYNVSDSDRMNMRNSVIKSESNDQNHFNPTYFGKGYRWHDPKVDRMEQGFLQARECFENDGRNVYNATFGGKLEVFERVEYESLFNE